ncbi:DMT family transporter, partial [Candidatus Sumerlaeota bacterium]|nr:DMT family transporter [Candidatus Sumerlaeota bacterium]
MLLTKRSTHVYPTTPMTAVQLSVVAILSLIGSLSAGEEMSFNLSGAETAAILFLAIFATALAFWMQTKMQKFTTEDRAGVIFLFEPLFAALAAWVAMGEELRPAQWAGAILILTSAAIPMLRPLSLSRRS